MSFEIAVLIFLSRGSGNVMNGWQQTRISQLAHGTMPCRKFENITPLGGERQPKSERQNLAAMKQMIVGKYIMKKMIFLSRSATNRNHCNDLLL
jgi:hypothetical protein